MSDNSKVSKDSKIQLLQERLLVDNRRIKLLDVLKEVLTCGEYSGIDITVGFLYLSGLKELKDELKQFFENGGRMRIIIGNVMQEKTFEQLVLAYGSVNKVKEQVTRFGPSSDELIETNSDVYSKIIANTAQNKDNEEMITLLKRWLESGQLQIRVFTDEYMHAKTYIFHHRSPTSLGFGLVGSSNLSLPGLYANTELNAPVTLGHYTTLKEWFEEMWKKSEDFNPALIKVISKSWANPEFLPPPYHVFIRGLYELYRDIIESEVKGLYITTLFEKLYDFQIDAARRAIHIAMKYGGVLISDVVGLGKTYIACATAHDLSLRNLYEGKPHQVAVIAPKHLVRYWEQMLRSFNIDGRVFSAGLLSISEAKSEKKREMLEYVREKAGVVIVDEAHKYTNPERINYKTLKPMLVGKYGILLTATPFRKSYSDLINIIRLFIHDPKPPFLGANSWEGLAKMLDSKIIQPSYILREVMIRRTRYDIIKLYGGKGNCIKFGEREVCFPERKLKTIRYSISDVYDLESIPDVVEKLTGRKSKVGDVYQLLVEGIGNMTYARFNLYKYVKPEYRDKKPYSELKQAGNLKGLTKMLFLKRLESSWYAFYKTVERGLIITKNFLKFLRRGVVPAGEDFEDVLLQFEEEEYKELTYPEIDEFISKHEIKYRAEHFDKEELLRDLNRDLEILEAMLELVRPLKEIAEENPLEDSKFAKLVELLRELVERGQKVIVFSEYSDTVEWLSKALEKLGLKDKWKIAAITSKSSNILEAVKRFAPKANNTETDDPLNVLIATDVLSEGLNLQDANVVVNYDITWTPVKLIQRIGRVDRIGTEHDVVYVYNFFPETRLDSHLGLMDTVKNRVREFNKALGSDGKILEESEEWNPSAIVAIYGEDLKYLEKAELEQSLSIAEGAELLLKEFIEKYPDLFEEIKIQHSMRSVCYWKGQAPLAFFVCTNGLKTRYYLLRYDNRAWVDYCNSLDGLVRETGLNLQTPPAKFERELYYSVAEVVIRKFREDIEELSAPVSKRKSRKLSKNLERLNAIRERTTTAEREELNRLFELALWACTNIGSFKSDFQKIKIEDDKKFVEAVKKLIIQYNIPQMKASYNKKMKDVKAKSTEPYIVAGLLFLPQV